MVKTMPGRFLIPCSSFSLLLYQIAEDGTQYGAGG